MYSIVLAMALAPGNAALAADIETDIRDLKRSVAELRKEQEQTRIDELKQVISRLRQQVTDDKLDELRRDVLALRHAEAVYHAYHTAAMVLPMPAAEKTVRRATIAVEIPAGATFVVNNQEVPVPPVSPTFITPPLEPGKDYFYDCKVTVKKDGKDVTKAKRIKVRAGEVVHINYEDMESH